MNEIHNKIVSYFKNLENPIILDIGCYRAEDSIIFSNMFPNGRIYSFEPDPRNIAYIDSNFLPFNIKLNSYAIGNVDGEIDFWPSENIDFNKSWNLSGSVRPPKAHLEEYTVSFGEKIKIRCKKLDTWYNDNLRDKQIQLIYCDANGSEGDIIEYGADTFKNTHLLYLEVFDKELYSGMKDEKWIDGKLKELGFEYLITHGHNKLYRNNNI